MNKTISYLLTAFACLAGVMSGAYAGLSWSALLASRIPYYEEDFTEDLYIWVLGGAVAGGFFVYIFIVLTAAQVRSYCRRKLTCEMQEQAAYEYDEADIWPPPIRSNNMR